MIRHGFFIHIYFVKWKKYKGRTRSWGHQLVYETFRPMHKITFFVNIPQIISALLHNYTSNITIVY